MEPVEGAWLSLNRNGVIHESCIRRLRGLCDLSSIRRLTLVSNTQKAHMLLLLVQTYYRFARQ